MHASWLVIMGQKTLAHAAFSQRQQYFVQDLSQQEGVSRVASAGTGLTMRGVYHFLALVECASQLPRNPMLLTFELGSSHFRLTLRHLQERRDDLSHLVVKSCPSS